jgi:hypothetical protein
LTIEEFSRGQPVVQYLLAIAARVKRGHQLRRLFQSLRLAYLASQVDDEKLEEYFEPVWQVAQKGSHVAQLADEQPSGRLFCASSDLGSAFY